MVDILDVDLRGAEEASMGQTEGVWVLLLVAIMIERHAVSSFRSEATRAVHT